MQHSKHPSVDFRPLSLFGCLLEGGEEILNRLVFVPKVQPLQPESRELHAERKQKCGSQALADHAKRSGKKVRKSKLGDKLQDQVDDGVFS
jgi:hypothetical protein